MRTCSACHRMSVPFTPFLGVDGYAASLPGAVAEDVALDLAHGVAGEGVAR